MSATRKTPTPSENLLLYDGVCALCNQSVRILLRVDRHRRLTFASLQSSTANAVRSRHRLPESLDAVLLVEHFGTAAETVHAGSTGALTSLAIVGGPWRVVSWLRVIPLSLRELVYRWLARNRYRWFGRLDACPLPPPEVADRFLD